MAEKFADGEIASQADGKQMKKSKHEEPRRKCRRRARRPVRRRPLGARIWISESSLQMLEILGADEQATARAGNIREWRIAGERANIMMSRPMTPQDQMLAAASLVNCAIFSRPTRRPQARFYVREDLPTLRVEISAADDLPIMDRTPAG